MDKRVIKEFVETREPSVVADYILQHKECIDRTDRICGERLETIDLLKERIAELEQVLRDAKEVYANAKNTPAVRSGHEFGGYLKYYRLEPYQVIAALRRHLRREADELNGEQK